MGYRLFNEFPNGNENDNCTYLIIYQRCFGISMFWLKNKKLLKLSQFNTNNKILKYNDQFYQSCPNSKRL